MNYLCLSVDVGRGVKHKQLQHTVDQLNNVAGVTASVKKGKTILDQVLQLEITCEDEITDNLILELGITVGTLLTADD